jgi:hypothetical protein
MDRDREPDESQDPRAHGNDSGGAADSIRNRATDFQAICDWKPAHAFRADGLSFLRARKRENAVTVGGDVLEVAEAAPSRERIHRHVDYSRWEFIEDTRLREQTEDRRSGCR